MLLIDSKVMSVLVFTDLVDDETDDKRRSDFAIFGRKLSMLFAVLIISGKRCGDMSLSMNLLAFFFIESDSFLTVRL